MKTLINWTTLKFKGEVYQCHCYHSVSRVWLFVTPWIAALQAPLSVGFPRQEYWSELLIPSPGEVFQKNPLEVDHRVKNTCPTYNWQRNEVQNTQKTLQETKPATKFTNAQNVWTGTSQKRYPNCQKACENVASLITHHELEPKTIMNIIVCSLIS